MTCRTRVIFLRGRSGSLQPQPAGFYARYGKRVLDVLLSTAGLIVFAVPMLLIAIAIRILDGPPVIFRQTRIGLYGSPFRICKFRTMRNGAAVDGTVTVAGDPRVSRLGRLLRRTKLDELPQLWNVFRGHMSFVGPRPDVPGFADRITGGDRIILSLRPGITGPATLAFRDEERLLLGVQDAVGYNQSVLFPAKVRMNRAYVERISLRSDLRMIAATVIPGISFEIPEKEAA